MDSARYHKRCLDPPLTTRMHKAEMQEWLNMHDIQYAPSDTHDNLMKLVRKNWTRIAFSVVEIAQAYGHEVLYTLPYHCELQPIEGVWGHVKNMVAAKLQNLLPETYEQLLDAFLTVDAHSISTLWLKALQTAHNYWEQDKQASLPPVEEEDIDLRNLSDEQEEELNDMDDGVEREAGIVAEIG
jgi:hypothetical protein